MKIYLPKLYFSKLMRAVTEFRMIDEGDRILVGLSGGKDSLFLLYALKFLQEKLAVKFSVMALNINPMFKADFSSKNMEEFCKKLDVPFQSAAIDIKSAVENSGGSPCFTCSYFRRGAINRLAKENNMNKVAYAHHNDDAVETFFMSLIYSGQLTTFSPVTYLDRTDVTVIRPLVYFREDEIKETLKLHGCLPTPSLCPYDGNTKRQKVKEIIVKLGDEIPDFYDHLKSAMRATAVGELWPKEKKRTEMKADYFRYMNR
ncbi:MAG: tRNA 2-thiocytidine biosynthesis protein TtcA [Selenomonadaceae bacterium]|nr:tRNA 2-thiocytidine biosynthesis protein TtcA [Selenomonadaceae bacterium]